MNSLLTGAASVSHSQGFDAEPVGKKSQAGKFGRAKQAWDDKVVMGSIE
jgi:hypothetical protein